MITMDMIASCCFLGKIKGYMRGLDSDNGKGSWGHGEINQFSGIPATTRGEDLRGKTNSAVAKLPICRGLAIISSTSSEVFSSSANTLSSSSDSKEATHPKCACRISSREDVSVPAKAILIHPRPSAQDEQ